MWRFGWIPYLLSGFKVHRVSVSKQFTYLWKSYENGSRWETVFEYVKDDGVDRNDETEKTDYIVDMKGIYEYWENI